jgi:hypothetical protein
VDGVRAFAYGAQAVQGRDPEPAGQIASYVEFRSCPM